jgi:hypothetical protein
MVSMSDEIKERKILKLILIVRFACATLDMGHPITVGVELVIFFENLDQMEPARIPNDRKHEFCRLGCVSFSFGNFFISW